MQLQQHQEAIFQFDQAIILNPNELNAYGWKGFSLLENFLESILEKQNNYLKAIQTYRQAKCLLGNQDNGYNEIILEWQKQR